jgi:hypothetical protein
MVAAGIDDGHLGAQIATLNGPTKQTPRETLLVQLAAAALEDDGPLPGADAEYKRARAAEAALQLHDADLQAVKARLRDRAPWGRLTLGYGAVGCLALFTVAKACGWILS